MTRSPRRRARPATPPATPPAIAAGFEFEAAVSVDFGGGVGKIAVVRGAGSPIEVAVLVNMVLETEVDVTKIGGLLAEEGTILESEDLVYD